jgi:CofD-related protein of GAK system
MSVRVSLRRAARVPDELRVARCRRAPELGPRILFFSGGSALRELSTRLKLYTHNSIHLVTPFDSGGSSAELRKAFDMLSVGDLRNRMLALADDGVRGTPELRELFSYRITDSSAADRHDTLEAMVYGDHPLMAAVPEPLQRIVRTYLRYLADRLPTRFELEGASVGNLVLAGGYLNHGRDIDAVLYLFSKLVEVRGVVRPVTSEHGHLAAVLEDGTRLVGQHRLTGKTAPEIRSPVRDLTLVDSLSDPHPLSIEAPAETRQLIRRAELLCFPMGSFYSSVIANLLPRGVGRSIAAAECPKIYVPSMGRDPEQFGMTLGDAVERIIDQVRLDAGEDTPVERILNWVLIDRRDGHYETRIDPARLKELGVEVVDAPLVADLQGDEGDESAPLRSRERIDSQRLCEILLSLV